MSKNPDRRTWFANVNPKMLGRSWAGGDRRGEGDLAWAIFVEQGEGAAAAWTASLPVLSGESHEEAIVRVLPLQGGGGCVRGAD